MIRLSTFLRPACLGSLLLTAATAPAATIIQELFDGGNLNVPISGQGANLTSSVGFAAGSTWIQNAGASSINTANNFNVVNGAPDTLPGPSPQAATPGGIWVNGGTYGRDIFATRQLSSSIDLNAAQTLYFSFRLNNAGDTAVGIGLASGSSASSNFLGVGAHWDNHLDPANVNAANSLYLSSGTLNQDLTGNNDGPYAALVHTAAGTLNGNALIVGRLTLGVAFDQIDLRIYSPGSTIEADPSSVAWSLSTPFNESFTATNLLVWSNGVGTGQLDAIRFGTSWVDVTAVPEPTGLALAGLAGMALLGRRRRVA